MLFCSLIRTFALSFVKWVIMFTQEDELLFAKRGITEAQVMEQLECFKKGFPYLSLDGAASVKNGIVKADENALEEASAQWNEYLQSNHQDKSISVHPCWIRSRTLQSRLLQVQTDQMMSILTRSNL